jgi:glycosyltransferase involved in cell wall biosynthesis
MISVIIPTCDEAVALGATLDSVAKNKTNKEVIIVDAGSVDGTSQLAGENASRVLFSLRRQRAYQMNLGTQDAHGTILLFLHADTALPASAFEQMESVLRNNGIRDFSNILLDSSLGQSKSAFFSGRFLHLESGRGVRGLRKLSWISRRAAR